LSGKPSNYSALRLKFSGASFTLNKYTYQRVDEFTTSAVVLLCSSDEDFEGDYRYGFNGMHKDDEIKGSGNSLDFGARVYDSRLVRWLSLDPLLAKYPSMSPYSFVGNCALIMIDPSGKVIEIALFRMVNDKPVPEIVVTYKDGQLYNKDGSQYCGNDEYIIKVAADLTELQNKGGSTISGIITHLQNSKNRHRIGNIDPHDTKKDIDKAGNEYFTNDENRTDANYGDGSSFTKYNGKDKHFSWDIKASKNVWKNPGKLKKLAHELTHAFDEDMSKPIIKDGTTKEHEGRAISVENELSTPSNPSRFSHGTKEYTEEELKCLNEEVNIDLQSGKK
jgi:RHS repeat-associated protein